MAEQSLAQTISTALATMSLDLDLKGGAEWAPLRNPKKDYSKWGRYEAWQYCKIGKINECLVGPVPTGDWIFWDSMAAPGQGQLGFATRSVLTAQQQAEILAVSQNQGKPTRVVYMSGECEASKYTLKDAQRIFGPALAEYEEQLRAQAEAAPQQ